MMSRYCFPLLFFILGCGAEEDRSIDIYSHQIQDRTEKLEKLREYFKKDTGLQDAEYHIWYKDNSAGWVPGPSDYHLRVALKVDTNSIDSWVTNIEPYPREIPKEYWEDLRLDSNEWKVESEPEAYHSNSLTEVKVVFRAEGIIFGAYSTMPMNFD